MTLALATLSACTSPSAKQIIAPEKFGEGTIHLMAVGDIMLGTDFPDNRLPPHNGEYILKPLTPLLKSADITFGNLEGVMMYGGEAEKKCSDPIRCYVFRSPVQYVQHLKTAGFDVLSLANNHAMDFGEFGRNRTEKLLDNVGIYHSGRTGKVASWKVKGRKIAMIAFSPFRGSNNMRMHDNAIEQVQNLARTHDVILVSVHAGAEGLTTIRIPFKEEIFRGEKRGDIVKFSRAMIKAGADIVLGHGPHVPRAIELYQDRLIAYSLGNFATYYGINIKDFNGLAPVLDVKLDFDGKFLSGKIHSTRQYRPVGPIKDYFNEAAKLMSLLTDADFPKGKIRIDDNGQIHLKHRKITRKKKPPIKQDVALETPQQKELFIQGIN